MPLTNGFSSRASPDRFWASGFTLIELSIVLVIIGLIVGGVLVGQDLIRAAEVRAEVSQMEKYNTAVNTFRTKYNALPGDIKDPDASNFGFASRGQYAGEGDGNGVIEGIVSDGAGNNYGNSEAAGETLMFWADLSKAKLIDGTFTLASSTIANWNGANNSYSANSSLVPSFFPTAKLGTGNFITVWSQNSINYFSLTQVVGNYGTLPLASQNVTVSQAAAIDAKMDDGLPTTGKITPQYWSAGQGGLIWSLGGGGNAGLCVYAAANTCFDNGCGTSPAKYTLSNANKPNCALSFQFQ